MEIAFFQRANAAHQISQWSGKGMRDEEDQHASACHCGKTQGEQQVIQVIQEGGRLIERFQHAQANRRWFALRQLHRTCQKTFISQLQLLGIDDFSRSGHGVSCKLRFLCRRKSASDNDITVIKGHLAGSDTTDLRSDAVIDFVPEYEKPQKAIFRFCTKIDRLDEYLIQVLRAKPPLDRTLLIKSSRERLLGHIPAETGSRSMQSDDTTSAVHQHKEVTPGQTPPRGRRV